MNIMNINVTKPIAIVQDSLQGDIDAFYGNLIPTLLEIKSKRLTLIT